jgi:hypothetical protein
LHREEPLFEEQEKQQQEKGKVILWQISASSNGSRKAQMPGIGGGLGIQRADPS